MHPQTRLVLVNAIYFLADWAHPFPAEQTKPRPFHLAGGEAPEVPMMEETATYAYAAPEHALMQLLIDYGAGCDVKSAERELGIRPLKEYAEMLEYVGVGEKAILGNDVQVRPQFDLWNIWYAERVLR